MEMGNIKSLVRQGSNFLSSVRDIIEENERLHKEVDALRKEKDEAWDTLGERQEKWFAMFDAENLDEFEEALEKAKDVNETLDHHLVEADELGDKLDELDQYECACSDHGINDASCLDEELSNLDEVKEERDKLAEALNDVKKWMDESPIVDPDEIKYSH